MDHASRSGRAGVMDVEGFLEHYGTRGMKWGVRKDKGHEGERTKTRKIAKLDKKFERSANLGNMIKVHNRAADLTNKHDVDRINNKPEYKDVDFRRDSPLRQQYYKEHQTAFLNNVQKAVNELGTNASGTRKLHMVETDDNDWYIEVGDVKHDDLDDFYEALTSQKVKVTYDARGHITKMEFEELSELEQTALIGENILAHYGILGMKWGKRRSKEEISAERQQVEVKIKAGKGVVKTSGGKELQPHDDAIKAKASKQRARASTTDALSNQELQALVTRMNLEQQYARLAGPKERSVTARGAAFLTKHLSDDAVSQPIRSIMTDLDTPAKGVSAFDKATIGAKILNPLLNPPTNNNNKKK